ncbi:hypothetical protein D3C77_529570 [compost metagenome]
MRWVGFAGFQNAHLKRLVCLELRQQAGRHIQPHLECAIADQVKQRCACGYGLERFGMHFGHAPGKRRLYHAVAALGLRHGACTIGLLHFSVGHIHF